MISRNFRVEEAKKAEDELIVLKKRKRERRRRREEGGECVVGSPQRDFRRRFLVSFAASTSLFFAVLSIRTVRILGAFQLHLCVVRGWKKGTVKILPFTNKVFLMANIRTTMKTLRGTQVCMPYWRNFLESGCAMVRSHCTYQTTKSTRMTYL